MAKFNSILIANRGEIAVRIIRSAKAMGMRTIAVYSHADENAPHVKLADEAVCIGASPAHESYLVVEKILDAAKKTNAGAVHPGYGFLSENADFANACARANIVFIGPSAEAIALMGHKGNAKVKMMAAGVPCVPGYEGESQDDEVLIAEAKKIGFPIMVKAVAGGGGRGMRLVNAAKELDTAIVSARSEALNAFGNGDLILEKAVQKPRHVEVQIFADTAGNTVHLGERDCSVQRRHQKVIEEAPCPILTQTQREQMGTAAVEAAKSIQYVGAGTVEFLLDTDGAFYFLEMNTRLQVEHPVTEMITGFDLVDLQIKVANGEGLGFTQDDVKLNGHAVEARLYAEDVAQDFLPMTGHIDIWEPALSEGVRVDTGIDTGSDISPFYDPMIAKIIAWGETREIATARLRNALVNTRLFGVTTNKAFLVDILDNAVFASGQATTAFIGEAFNAQDLQGSETTAQTCVLASVLNYEYEAKTARENSLGVNSELLNWGSQGRLMSEYKYAVGEDDIAFVLTTTGRNCYSAQIDDTLYEVTVKSMSANAAVLDLNGTRMHVGHMAGKNGQITIDIGGRIFELQNLCGITQSLLDETGGGGGRVVAPMHGTLLEILVKQGDEVKQGDRLAVLEAMKMQHDILAEVSGNITAVKASQGDQIPAGDVILIIEPTKE
ncbi:MAG: 3-methylcrotonyl-CoA carboxylase [Robiginitomaculum sp.]|nr:MAG: 3-methylcrotonyl-CoA carboxylase [Robiginitomaculum sp.]